MSNIIRSLARSRAKDRMKRKGMVHICKRSHGTKSYFAENWRKYAK